MPSSSFQKTDNRNSCTSHISIPVMLTAFISINALAFSFAFQIPDNRYRIASFIVRGGNRRLIYHLQDDVLIPRLRVLSFLTAAFAPDEEYDNRDSDDEREFQKESDLNVDVTEKDKTKPSILPPPPKETSYRFPLRKRGVRTRIRRSTSRPSDKGEHYKSILPPPPPLKSATASDKFSNGQNQNLGLLGGNVHSRTSVDNGKYDASTRPSLGGLPKVNHDASVAKFSNREKNQKDEEDTLLPSTKKDSVLTSWDDFFATRFVMDAREDNIGKKAADGPMNNTGKDYLLKALDRKIHIEPDLPSTSYLFGTGNHAEMQSLSSSSMISPEKISPASSATAATSLPSLDGVLPVSELFYRSTQAISIDDPKDNDDYNLEGSSRAKETDDEELPFSAEQSDRILTNNNKILMRRNTAMQSPLTEDDEGSEDDKAQYKTDFAKLKSSSVSLRVSNQSFSKRNRRKRGGRGEIQRKATEDGKGRKMVRRGMEMLVGGEPINADPPLRCVELSYCFKTAEELLNAGLQGDLPHTVSVDLSKDWASVITTNSRDFGPLLHKPSVVKVSELSRQLYCEHFVDSCMKWNVCPMDLKLAVKAYESKQNGKIVGNYEDLIERVSTLKFNDAQAVELRFGDKAMRRTTKPEGFGKDNRKLKKKSSSVGFSPESSGYKAQNILKNQESYTLGGELKFSLGVTRAELESGHDGGSHGHILRRVLGRGIANAVKAESLGFQVVIAKMILNELDGGSTEFNVQFNLVPIKNMEYSEIELAAKKLKSALAQAMDDGDMALAMGAAARVETSWPAKIRDRVVEEFLFDAEDEYSDQVDDDGEEDLEEDYNQGTGNQRSVEYLGTLDDEDDFESRREVRSSKKSDKGNKGKAFEEDFDGPFGMPGDTIYSKDDLYLGGGNGGVFPDYSENGKSISPYGGDLGPILLDAVTQRALQRQPRVIAIGDVHGCIDELQALLRKCDYRPGDLIIFLGDLVSKGPDSLSVVQMARELGAIGVRGNHDFEVIRWHQAIKSGVDPPVIGSEHYQIASTLSKADLRWMYSLPWYLSSKELNALFVHAGFVSGIRLGKQNPRLMMNMRSILPDGTVTSKFFNNWPWARLWDGPQTVLFGHDADRGLQQYEHAIGLDTGCVYGGRLTACILPEKRLISVNAKKEYFHYRRKHFD
eukprot:CAMPEP_0176491836 /NCGR_PEP_ID=MMETSP0200_2-20121128/8647_1 /TAXON_ID=947934 /ORGANISM="Chaetoceros sp., Strain GSL56" /LENGTH=1163 /DNA_ID=CAMNT_0017889297 /DNA_START=48 /DNA_END=3539 /DNA_ORIENTATION=+